MFTAKLIQIKLVLILFFTTVMFWCSYAIAETPPPPTPLSDEQQQALNEVTEFYNSIKTMEGDFIQEAPDLQRTTGRFYISRPGKVLFKYDKPARYDVISDGSMVSILDKRTRTQDLWPLGKTPLKFLVSEEIDIEKDTNLVDVRLQNDLIILVIREESLLVSSEIALLFDEKTKELRQWVVSDSQGITKVAIFNVDTGLPANPDNFKINYRLNDLNRNN